MTTPDQLTSEPSGDKPSVPPEHNCKPLTMEQASGKLSTPTASAIARAAAEKIYSNTHSLSVTDREWMATILAELLAPLDAARQPDAQGGRLQKA